GVDDAERARRARRIRTRLGMLALPADEGLALFDAALAADAALVVPVKLDLPGLRAAARTGPPPALLRGLVRAPADRGGPAGRRLASRLAGVAPDERDTVIIDLVRAAVAAALGHESAAAVDPDQAFRDLGFDSLAAVELRDGLTRATGLRLPAT